MSNASDALGQLIDTAQTIEQSGLILSDHAERLAADVLTATDPQRGLTVGAVLNLAWYHWLRYLALPAGADMPDFLRAIELFTTVHGVEPAFIPLSIRWLLPAEDAVYPDDPDDLVLPALQVLRFVEFLDVPPAVDYAILLLRRALAIAGGPAGRFDIAGNLGIALFDRASRPDGAQVGDLDEAIDLGRQAVRAMPAHDGRRAAMLSGFSNMLWRRFEQRSDPGDLDEAITLAEDALLVVGDDSEKHAGLLNNLAVKLRSRFSYSARPADLERAVALGRAAVTVLPAGHQDRETYRNNLAVTLHTRFKHHRERSDISAAVTAARESIAALRPGDRRRSTFISNLAAILQDRFDARRDPQRGEDLDEAIALQREALATTVEDSPAAALHLANLTNNLAVRFALSGDPADLDDAIEAGIRSIELHQGTLHQWQAPTMSNLGRALRQRYQQSGQDTDIADAILYTKAAVRATTHAHPERAKYLINLAEHHSARFLRVPHHHDLRLAARYLHAAAALVASPARERVDAAERWGIATALLGDWDTATVAYGTAVALLPEAAWRAMGRASREDRLLAAQGIGADAAAVCVAAGLPGDAVTLGEQGRGVLWSQQLDTLADLAELRRLRPDLATRLHEIGEVLR